MSATKDDIRQILEDPIKFAEICKSAFESVDIDNSGSINLIELGKCLESIAIDLEFPIPNEEEVLKCYKELDTDQNNILTCDEFSVLVKQLLELSIS